MYDALTIAMYVISKCFNEGSPVTNLRLQKLLYFIQLESYRKNGSSFFKDELYAWQFGPVIPSVYYEYNMYGGSPILLSYDNLEISISDSFFVDRVVEEKKDTPIWSLVEQTHKKGGPWERTVTSYGLRSVIEKNFIMEEAKVHC